MTGRKKEDTVASASFANVEASGAFEIRCGFRSNLQAKCRSKWAAYVDSWVFLGAPEEKWFMNCGPANLVKTDSLNATSTSVMCDRARISLQPMAATSVLS